MMFDREGGYREKVRSYYLPGNTPAPPQEHRAHGSTSNAVEELINLTHLLFSARGAGAPAVEEGMSGSAHRQIRPPPASSSCDFSNCFPRQKQSRIGRICKVFPHVRFDVFLHIWWGKLVTTNIALLFDL